MSRAQEIADNLATVRERVAAVCNAVGRSASAVRLLAVSKTVAPEDIVDALAAGQQDFGENYGQEFRDKHAAVATLARVRPELHAVRWHFIGPLQTNKVKYVAGKVALVHAVDSWDVLAELERKTALLGRLADCLVQVNVAGEAQKRGIPPASLPTLLDGFATLPHLRCTGLMVMPPYDEDAELSRPHFAALRELRDRHRQVRRTGVDLVELSMGMSHDLEVAIAEGATIIRVGTAIFGTRQG